MEMILKDSIHILRWHEDVTLQKTKDFKHALEQLIRSDCDSLILSLRGMAYINSSGLGAIAHSVMQARKQDKQLVVCELEGSVAEIFTIVKFESFIKLFDQEQDAIDYFNKLDSENYDSSFS